MFCIQFSDWHHLFLYLQIKSNLLFLAFDDFYHWIDNVPQCFIRQNRHLVIKRFDCIQGRKSPQSQETVENGFGENLNFSNVTRSLSSVNYHILSSTDGDVALSLSNRVCCEWGIELQSGKFSFGIWMVNDRKQYTPSILMYTCDLQIDCYH